MTLFHALRMESMESARKAEYSWNHLILQRTTEECLILHNDASNVICARKNAVGYDIKTMDVYICLYIKLIRLFITRSDLQPAKYVLGEPRIFNDSV